MHNLKKTGNTNSSFGQLSMFMKKDQESLSFGPNVFRFDNLFNLMLRN